MAKVTFLQGKARGKVGGIVYRTVAGIGTVASEYNPSPRNPRTIAQVNQRGKMNLAGQLSKITPFAAIAGMGSSRRVARQNFISEVLKAITAPSGANGFATLEYERIRISDGVSSGVSVSATVSTDTGVVTITPDVSGAVYPVLGYVAVCYYTDRTGEVAAKAAKFDASTSPMTMTIIADAGDVAFLYLVPILDTGEDARAAFAALELMNSGMQAGVTRTLVSSGAYGLSLPWRLTL